jgi:hypothetical protein
MQIVSMKAYSENKGIVKKRTSKKEKGTPPLNPPSMGE